MNVLSCIPAIALSLALSGAVFAQGDLPKSGKDAGEAKKESPNMTKGPTTIDSESMFLDSRSDLLVYSGKVVLKHPDFDISCDKLTAYLKKNATKAKISTSPEGSAPAPAEKKEDGGGKIERAVAEGNVLIVQNKVDESGKPKNYTATGEKAVYETGTGDVTISGNPKIVESMGGNLAKQIKARVDDTVIILNRDRGIRVNGLSTTTLVETSDLDAKTTTTPR